MTPKLKDKWPVRWSPYQVITASATDPGKVRTNNEDAYTVFTSDLAGKAHGSTGATTVAVLADGVGGATAGEHASSIAVTKVHELLATPRAAPLTERISTAIREANQTIYGAAKTDPELAGMASTIVVAAVDDSSLYVAHVGDSRAYLIRNDVAEQLTVDHSWIQSAIEAGQISPSEIEDHPKRHVVTRSLGTQPSVEVDSTLRMPSRSPGTPAETEPATLVDRLLLRPGDVVLLCSDGLTDALSVAQIQQVLRSTPFAEAAQTLVDRANEAGGPDNVTVVLVKVVSNYRLPVIAGAGLLAVLFLSSLLFALWPRQNTNVPEVTSATSQPVTIATRLEQPPPGPPIVATAPSITSAPATPLASNSPGTMASPSAIETRPAPTVGGAAAASATAEIGLINSDSVPAPTTAAALSTASSTVGGAAIITSTLAATDTPTSPGAIGTIPTAITDVTPTVGTTTAETYTADVYASSQLANTGNTPAGGEPPGLAATSEGDKQQPDPNPETLQAPQNPIVVPNEGLLLPDDNAPFASSLVFAWSVNAAAHSLGTTYELVYWPFNDKQQEKLAPLAPPISSMESTVLSVFVHDFPSPAPAPGTYFWNVRIMDPGVGTSPKWVGNQPRTFRYGTDGVNSGVPVTTTGPGVEQTPNGLAP